jgi:predicted RecA/RadA family phage recombinase
MRNFIQPGNNVTLLAPTGGVVSGQGVLIGDLFGVALADAAAGARVALQVTGVVEMLKAAGTIAPGARVFWDAAAGRVTTTVTGNRCIGHHVGETANDGAAGAPIRVLLGSPNALGA